MVVAGNAGVRLVGQRREGLTSRAYVIRWSEGGYVGWLRGRSTLLTRVRGHRPSSRRQLLSLVCSKVRLFNCSITDWPVTRACLQIVF